ncbi:MAG: hypothetical protein AB7O24_16935 [Kofleriaceae bacterium]
MKIAILLVLFVAAHAIAGPAKHTRSKASRLDGTLSPRVSAAERAWTNAEQERDPTRQVEGWERSAAAFGDVVEHENLDPKAMSEAARAAVLSWRNAIAMSGNASTAQSGERTRAIIAAYDAYITHAIDPTDPQVIGVKFLKAQLYHRRRQLDLAVPLLREILDHHRQHESAEPAAQLLLDCYNQLGQHDHMLALVDELARDDSFLAGKPELQATIRALQTQAERKRLEQLAEDAKRSGDLESFTAVGQGYLDLYNANPADRGNDEVLYNAGVAFQSGRSSGAAIQTFTLMQAKFPNSKLMPRVIVRTAKLYGDIAMYGRAAELFEHYAKRYPTQPDAVGALNDAVVYRKALGDLDRAIEDTRFLITMFGRSHPREVADASWVLVGLHETKGATAAQLDQLRRYIADHGSNQPDRLVIAHTKLGQLLWRQSCPITPSDDLCIRRNAHPPRMKRCSDDGSAAVTVVKRDPRKRQAALAAFAQAVQAYEQAGALAGDEAAARHHYAIAKLVTTDDTLERFLEAELPARSTSQQRGAWMEPKTKLAVIPRLGYEAIFAIGDPASSAAAAGRLGQLYQSYSDALVARPIPKDVLTAPYANDKADAYCSAMVRHSEPLASRAVESFSACLTQSIRTGLFTEWSKLCERELVRIRPAEFPPLRERRGQPAVAAPIVVTEGLPAQGR